MTEKESQEVKGLLLIDASYNTILIPMKSSDMREVFGDLIKENLKYVKQHKKKSELDADIRAYMKCQYHNELREEYK